MSDCILGIDLGTSSLKAVAYTLDLRHLADVRVAYGCAGRDIQARDWWNACVWALRQLGERIDLGTVQGISFAGYNAFVGVGDNLAQTTPVMLYYNVEPVRHMRRLYTTQDEKLVFDRACTNLFGSGYMAPGIRWLHDTQPEAYAKTRCFLFSNGYIAACMTGRRTMDASRASLTSLHDPRGKTLDWDAALCALFGVEQTLLPEIVQPWSLVGTLTQEAAATTGLQMGTPVIAGSMDSMCAALGNCIFQENEILDIGGSAGGLACLSRQPRPDRRFYLVRYALPNLWCNIAPLVSSARLFDWFAQRFGGNCGMEGFVRLVSCAPEFSRGVMFLPLVGGCRFPYWTEETAGHFLRVGPESGLQDMARAVVEGLSCVYRWIFDELQALGVQPSCIIAAGGDSRFAAWVQSKANHVQFPYGLSETAEASAKGAATLAAYHLSPDSVIQARSEPRRTVEPEREREYQAHYEAFRMACNHIYEQWPEKS